jgi:hypothetical protein
VSVNSTGCAQSVQADTDSKHGEGVAHFCLTGNNVEL